MDARKWTVDKQVWVLSFVAILLILWGLYGVFPYGFGYGNVARPVFDNLFWMWNSEHMPEWGHCWLVPLICAGLIIWKRDELAGLSVEGGKRGAIIWMVAAGFVYWVGYKIDIVPLSLVSIQITLGALILWFFGWPLMRVLLFPYLFLFFAWPMPFLESSLAFQLKIFMTQISVGFLNLIGVECLRRGSAIISVADYQYQIPEGARFRLEVDDPCSGIHSLFALMMISALAGYILLPRPWQRWVLFSCSLPLAVAGNFVRILLLTFGTLLFGQEFALGHNEHPSFYHMFSGFAVFGVAMAGMLAFGWLLNGGWRIAVVVLGLDGLLRGAPSPAGRAKGKSSK